MVFRSDLGSTRVTCHRIHGVQEQELEGTVKYVSQEKGYGFIECQAWLRRKIGL